jgi:pimeloyl-ACP methyl ester carboxylesterase
VILLHGFGSQRSELVDHLKYLHDAGYDVLMYDARACGQSGGEFSTLGWREQDDLRAAIDLVGTRTAGRPVFAMGFSLGAATAVLEGADDPRLQAVVANAVFTSIDDITWRAFPHFSRPSMPAFPFAPMAVLIGELRLGHDSATIRPVDTIGLLAPRPLLLITGSLDEIVTPPDVDRLWAAAGAGAERWDVPGGAHPGNPTEPFLLAPVEYKERVLAFFEGALGPTRP